MPTTLTVTMALTTPLTYVPVGTSVLLRETAFLDTVYFGGKGWSPGIRVVTMSRARP